MQICLAYAKKISESNPAYFYQAVPVCHKCHRIYNILDDCRNRYMQQFSEDSNKYKLSKVKQKLRGELHAPKRRICFEIGKIFDDDSDSNSNSDDVEDIIKTHRR